MTSEYSTPRGQNLTDRMRRAWSTSYIPDDALYTGMPYYMTDGLGLAANKPFDHPSIPIAGAP